MSLDPQNHLVKALKELFLDPQEVHLEISKGLAWQVLCTIQLACRHPANKGPTRDSVEAFARQLQKQICGTNNDLRLLAEMGWDARFDSQVTME